MQKGKWISGEDRIDGRFFGRAQIEEELGRVKEGDSFDYAKLRRALANLNANPDLQIDVSLSATNLLNTVAGGSKHVAMEITARESLPLHGMIEVNNFGMDVEEWQVAMSLQYMNLWDKKHVLTLSGSTSVGAELMSIAGSYMAPHKWWRGGNTTLYGGLSRLDVNGIVPRLDLEGSGWFAGLQHSEYLTDQDDDHLWAVSAGILWRYMEDRYTAYGSIRLNERDISIMPLSLALSYTGRRDFSGWWENNLGGRNFMTLQGVYNVASAGDDMADMWTDADEHYWILRAQLSRLQPLPWTWMPFTKESGAYGYESQWMLFLKLEGQYTSNVLIPVEKLSLGGYNAMRGYRTRGYIGDYGVYGTAELRTPILINGIWSWFGDDDRKFVFDRFQALCFLDYGWTSFNDLPAGYDSSEFLFSAGVGFRAALSQYFQMRLDLAFPLKNAYGDDDNMELYFSVQAQF